LKVEEVKVGEVKEETVEAMMANLVEAEMEEVKVGEEEERAEERENLPSPIELRRTN
jgi:hypothetical protein